MRLLIRTTAGDMRNLKQLEPSEEATVALAHRRLIEHALASEFHVAPANCESFLHLIFDRIGRGRGSVCATGHCFDAIFRSELTEGRARRALQPSAFSECRKINSRWGIPSTRAIAGA